MKNKLVLLLLVSFFMIGTVIAIWIISISSTATYTVTNDPQSGLAIVRELAGQIIEVNHSDFVLEDEFEFLYEGVGTNMNILINTARQDIDDNCTNWENDCDITYNLITHYAGVCILNESSNLVPIKTGTNIIHLNITCAAYSCPQEITPSISVEKLPL